VYEKRRIYAFRFVLLSCIDAKTGQEIWRRPRRTRRAVHCLGEYSKRQIGAPTGAPPLLKCSERAFTSPPDINKLLRFRRGGSVLCNIPTTITSWSCATMRSTA